MLNLTAHCANWVASSSELMSSVLLSASLSLSDLYWSFCPSSTAHNSPQKAFRYTCTIRLVRDRIFGDWIKPLHVRWSRIISAFCFFVFVFVDAVIEVLEAVDEFNDLQYLASTKGSSSASAGGRSCTCVFYCTPLETFLSLFLHFMVYSLETVTEAFWAFLLLFFISFPPPVSFVVLRKSDADFYFIYLFYITIIIKQCK